jgi:hypothetical protein
VCVYESKKTRWATQEDVGSTTSTRTLKVLKETNQTKSPVPLDPMPKLREGVRPLSERKRKKKGKKKRREQVRPLQSVPQLQEEVGLCSQTATLEQQMKHS